MTIDARLDVRVAVYALREEDPDDLLKAIKSKISIAASRDLAGDSRAMR